MSEKPEEDFDEDPEEGEDGESGLDVDQLMRDLDTRKRRSARASNEPAWRRLWPIAQHEFRGLFRGGWGVALFLLCILPSIVNLVILLVGWVVR